MKQNSQVGLCWTPGYIGLTYALLNPVNYLLNEIEKSGVDGMTIMHAPYLPS